MKTELILKSDVLDLLFENRNKEYGAYNLRKFYDNRLAKSVAAMLGLAIVISAFTFLPKKKVAAIKDDYETKMFVLPVAKEKIKEAEKPNEPARQKIKNPTQIFTAPIIVNKDLEPVKDLVSLSDTAAIASFNNAGQPGTAPVIDGPITTGIGGSGKDLEPAKPVEDITTPRDFAEVMPTYPGGMDALRKFLQRNLNNPEEMEEGEEVSVQIKFVVDYDGKLQGFVTVKDGGEQYNKEVIRVLKKMPIWVPGKSNGRNVSVYFTIPVKFIPAN